MQGDPEDADAPGRMLDHGQDVGLGAVAQVDAKVGVDPLAASGRP
jgi:hypothetical protein